MKSTEPSTDAYSIAKKALRLIGQFNTPPTPTIFEVWYRYVQGRDQKMAREMEHAVTEAKTVSVEMLHSLHQQYCENHDSTSETVGESLIAELDRFQQLVVNQQAAGTEFETTIDAASEILSGESHMPSQASACIQSLASGAMMMKGHLKEASQKLQAAQSQVANLQQELIESRRGLLTDHLTGIGNRRFFDALISKVLREPPAEKQNVYLALFDIDHFKSINDTFGHAAGDQVIRFIATKASELHPEILLARIGGDEFAAVMRAEQPQSAMAYAEELRAFFASQMLKDPATADSIGPIYLSIGMARLRGQDDARTWFERADKLLYHAKDLGRNRVVSEKVRHAIA